ncbi:MAG: cyclic nucleotide-binding domain-containing protein [Oscillatoriales cyanobacterium RM2_1_1]|nr:cyclic nucleotide-binding domain-containing protein [Oscillatoriales cyanobacterium RM2_1_1]
MFAQLPERRMHWLRWSLTLGWLVVIASLFYDPWSSILTEPDHPWSPLRISGDCVPFQDECLVEQPYPLGATLFWGAVVPSGIFILLVFGHECWRRICPLSFLSQIPRALGRQRQFKRENQQTGKVRYELAKVKSDSWLGRNYSYLQFGWLFVGLCGRILFFNADRLVLGGWLLFTIGAAIGVGYYYGGKSWCQYFCPMAPVQTIFSEPRGLLGSKAHASDQRITQSMCRQVLPDGNEQSACVACQSPCIDIDSERTYWDGLNKPEETLIRYGYVGLVIGYFGYYYLYAGNWDYYFSGIWNREPDQLASLMSPGLYLAGQAINLPKLIAVPLVLGGSTAIGYLAGKLIEKYTRQSIQRHRATPSSEMIRHQIFALCTFGIFNFFFFFAGRPLIQLLPPWVQYLFDVGIVFLSTLWLQKTWQRNPDLYSREGLASRFRKQLEKLQLDVSQFLEGRSLNDLRADELYVLAKVLPGFTRDKRHQAYKGVVRESLEEGYVSTASSLEVLQQMRQELGISEDEHREVLEELNIEDPELLDPNRQWSLENQIRLSGYQKSLERLIRLQQIQANQGIDPINSSQAPSTVQALRSEYSITPQEEDWILRGLSEDESVHQKIEGLLARLAEWVACDRALNHPILHQHPAVLKLLQETTQQKQAFIVGSSLETLSTLPDPAMALAMAQSLKQLVPQPLAQYWQDRPRAEGQNHLGPEVLQALMSPVANSKDRSEGHEGANSPTPDTLSYLELLLQHYNPLVKATALYGIAQLDTNRAQGIAQELLDDTRHPLIRTTAEKLALPGPTPLSALPTLEKLIYLFNSDFFHRSHTNTLMALGDRAEVKTYSNQEVITEAGDTCRELLLLIAGEAHIVYQLPQPRIEQLHPGQILDELEVLTHSTSENTIVAASETTRILAIPVEAFDDLLDQDPDLARRILELESRQLQRLVSSGSLPVNG